MLFRSVNDGGILISFDPATGNVIKQGRLQGAIDKYFSSPVAADDKVFLIGEGGAMSVLKATGDWEILKVNQLDDECFATPAIADGRIYGRGAADMKAGLAAAIFTARLLARRRSEWAGDRDRKSVV